MRNFFVFANFVVLCAALPSCSALAGPLLDDFIQRLPADVIVSHDAVETVGGRERLGRLLLEEDAGVTLQLENAVLENISGGIFLRGDAAVLTTATGLARAETISMVVPLLAWLLSDRAGTMPIHGAFEAKGLAIEMAMTPMGGGEVLTADRVAVGRADGGEVLAMLVDDASLKAPSGETLTLGSVRANFPAISGEVRLQDLSRFGIEVADISASRANGQGIVALDAAAFRFRSAQPIVPEQGHNSMLGRLGTLYNALSTANFAVQADYSGLLLPKANLMPGELGEILPAQPGVAFSGDGSVQLTVSSGQLELSVDQRLGGVADISVRLSAALTPLDRVALLSLDRGTIPELTDFPQVSLQRVRLRYQNQGVEQIVAGFGLVSLKASLDAAAKPYLDRAGEAAGSVRQLLGVVGNWIERGRDGPVCAISQMADGTSVSLTEIVIIAMISPDVAARQLQITDQGCADR